MTRPMRSVGLLRLVPWGGTAVVVATFATGCAAHRTTTAQAGVATPYTSTDTASGALGVSVGEGPPGTVITLNAIRCPPHGSKPDAIFWRDSAHPDNKGGVPLTGIVRTGSALQATFVVPANAPAGVGFFETYCGAKGTGATAGFTVDAP